MFPDLDDRPEPSVTTESQRQQELVFTGLAIGLRVC